MRIKIVSPIVNLVLKTKVLTIIWGALVLVSCNSAPSADAYITADIRKAINNLQTLQLADEIESVSYIPLELTEDDESLIDMILGYAVTNKYIYVFPFKEPRVALFDRQGRFIKTLIRYGQGPGEFNGTFMSMQADEVNNILYLYSTDGVFMYTLEGEFIKSSLNEQPLSFRRQLDKDRFAAVAFPYVPFHSGSFGIGIFTESGDTIVMKNDFYSSLVPPEKSGFTLGLTQPTYSKQYNSVLFKTGSNDTVFRISNNMILPACILKLQNSDNEVIRSLDATDFSSLFSTKFEEDGDIFVSDMFETAGRYYFRLRYNQAYYVASVDKHTGETLAEKCRQPAGLDLLGDANLQLGMVGTASYHNFPVWGSTESDYLVQTITSYELSLFKDVDSISIPESLKEMDEDGNPILILYKIN